MKAYWITRCHVHDAAQYNEYIKLAGPAIRKHGGTFLVRGGEQIELEGGEYERTVLVEFNSIQINYYCEMYSITGVLHIITPFNCCLFSCAKSVISVI